MSEQVAGELKGAYVRAWVYVDLHDDGGDKAWTDDDIRAEAAADYARDGEIEFDTDAEVSRSHENG